MEAARFRQIYQNEANQGGLRTGGRTYGGCEGAGEYRTCKEYKKGPSGKTKCAKYEKFSKSPKQKKSGRCNPWIMFLQEYSAQNRIPYNVILQTPEILADAKMLYYSQKAAYERKGNNCRSNAGINRLAY